MAKPVAFVTWFYADKHRLLHRGAVVVIKYVNSNPNSSNTLT